MPFAHRDPRLRRAGLFCFAWFLACLYAFLTLNGCLAPRQPDIAFYVMEQGVTGHSMDPVKFPVPTVAVVVGFDTLQAGQICVRSNPDGTNTAHRLTRKVGDEWEMKGDNNPLPDAVRLTRANFRGWVPEPS